MRRWVLEQTRLYRLNGGCQWLDPCCVSLRGIWCIGSGVATSWTYMRAQQSGIAPGQMQRARLLRVVPCWATQLMAGRDLCWTLKLNRPKVTHFRPFALGLYESKLSVHFEAYLTIISLFLMFFPLLDIHKYVHLQIFRNAARSRSSDRKAVLLRRWTIHETTL